MPITVKAAWNIPDEDLVPIDSVWVQFEDAGLGQSQQVDLSNYILSGYRIPFGPGTGLTATPATGAAYVNGKLVSTQPGARTFTASTDTWRWILTDGSLYYFETALNADPPTGPGGGALLIGKTTTNAADILWDSILCGFLTPEGESFEAV